MRNVNIQMVGIWTDTVHVNPMYHFARQRLSELLKPEINRRLTSCGYPIISPQSVNIDVMRHQKRYPYAPALFALAGALEPKGYSIGFTALDVEKERINHVNWLDEVVKKMSLHTNLAVLISFVTSETDRMIDFCQRLKEYNSDLVIIVGGVHAFYYPLELMQYDCIDFVVIGEGEETIVELLEAVENGKEYAEIQGIAYRYDDRICVTKQRKNLENLKSLPVPAYHLVESYTAERILFTPTFSRGCPFGCDYCSESYFWNKTLRHKDPIKFADELEILNKEFKQKIIHIADSTFGLEIDKLNKLCTELERRNLDCLFSINARPDLFTYMNETILMRLMKLNFFEIYIGAESASQETINNLHRKQTDDILINTLAKLKHMNFPIVKLYLMIGSPGETHSSMQSTIGLVKGFLEQELILYATAKFFVPAPGTPLFDNTEHISKKWSEYDRYNFPPLYNVSKLSDIELDCYLVILQDIQMNYYLSKSSPQIQEEHKKMLIEYVDETYQKQIYF